MSAAIGVGAIGEAIAAKLAGERFDAAVVLTDAVTDEVERIATASLADGTPVLITVLDNTGITVGPLYRPGADAPEAQPDSAAPIGVLAHHVTLAAEVTRWYVQQSYEDTIIVELFGCRLRRRGGAR